MGHAVWALVVGTFVAAFVECVEALTIVLAMGLTRGWRSALAGTVAALVALTAFTAVVGYALATWLPRSALQLGVGARGRAGRHRPGCAGQPPAVGGTGEHVEVRGRPAAGHLRHVLGHRGTGHPARRQEPGMAGRRSRPACHPRRLAVVVPGAGR